MSDEARKPREWIAASSAEVHLLEPQVVLAVPIVITPDGEEDMRNSCIRILAEAFSPRLTPDRARLAITHQMRVLSQKRIHRFISAVTPAAMDRIEASLMDVLDIRFEL
ncbi:hypothetical protein LCGC14_0334690 [marine sediment metagenome]|uniref:Uncharacterized protein n=1 Tax=marine sediment metagenome TaxID=412755 RepID=A0A0F9W2S7_9ZZZZ